MDVTYGLLSNLVKTKSIQRILAPIASQISLLIILNESEDGSSIQAGEMVPCSQAVMQASNKLITVAKQQAQSSTDKEFIAQTLSSCEVLEMSCSNLNIASERLEATTSGREARNRLVQASKDVLQGTMKVLLVADDAEIRRIVTATHIVTQKLSLLNDVDNMQALVHTFKGFTAALSVMMSLADKRQRDIIHSKQRERIITSLNVLKKCVASLSATTQNAIKYNGNPQAQLGKSFIMTEVQSALRDIVDAVQNRDTDQNDGTTVEPGYFVTRIDLILDALSEESRVDLHIDLEMWTEDVICHSMTVAHLCHDSHRDLIVHTCQRVIQVKSRGMLIQKTATSNPDMSNIHDDYNDTCETWIDECCELEKNVNLSLLHLVVEYFKETTQPLERLVKHAVYSDTKMTKDDNEGYITEFEDHSEKICQVATLASASSTDARRVHVIHTSVQRLEHLDPEIVAAILAISRLSQDKCGMRHLKLLMKEWTFELTNLVQVLDEMTDPKMFLLVSERKVEDDINTCNGCALIRDDTGLTKMLQSLLGRSRRVVQVTERIVDTHDDPVFRNGLTVFILQLKKAITAVRTAGSNLGNDLTNKQYQDTLRRRFNLLQDCLIKVKAGLNHVNHPHILSPMRRGIRGGSKDNDRKAVSPRTTNPVNKKISKLSQMHGGDHFVATSAPRLSHTKPSEEVDKIHYKTVTSQLTELPRSSSLSEVVPASGQTYAWRLLGDLVTWSVKGDKHRVNGYCGDILGWTNHIVDVSHTVLAHCHDVDKKRSMEKLCYEVDQLAPVFLEKVKYVLHGDFSTLSDMKAMGNQWVLKVEKIRVFVDITVEDYISITDKVCESAKQRKQGLVKHQLQTIQGHQLALCDLVSITGRLRWESQVKGDTIDLLTEEKNDLENLSITLTTTAEMITEQGLSDDVVQLETLGREWCVKVYSIVSNLTTLSGDMLALGLQRKVWPRIDNNENLVQTLQEENTHLKELMKSVCYGDEEKKELFRGFHDDMKECVEDLKSCTMRKKVSSANVAMVTHHYSNLTISLYRGLWILKGVQCLDLARQQTCMYSGGVDSLIEGAFCTRQATGEAKAIKTVDFQAMLDEFNDKIGRVKKKVLSGIQLSAELGKRSTVRQCLDGLSNTTPKVIEVVTILADGYTPSNLGDVSWYRLFWSAKLRHLVTVLGLMEDVKSSLVPDILKMFGTVDSSLDYDDISDKLTSEDSDTQPTRSRKSHNTSDATITTTNNSKVPTAEHSTQSMKPNFTNNKIIETSQPPKQSEFHPKYSKVSAKQSKPHGDSGSKNSNRKSHDTSVDSDKPRSSGRYAGSKHGFQGMAPVLNTVYVADEDPKWANFDPVVVDLIGIEEQIHLNASRALETTVPDSTVTMDTSTTSPARPSQRSPPRSHGQTGSRSSDRPYDVMKLLEDAQYLQHETDQWEDDNNPVVKVAKTMATQIHHMTQYMRREGPIKSHLGLVQTAKAMAENSQKVIKFAQILMKHCVDESFCADLCSYTTAVPTITQQLLILANVQLGTSQSDTADRMLVQNGQNLMKKILHMMSACEAVCIKGLTATSSDDTEDVVVLATQWRKKYLAHLQQGMADMNTDELGLRIVEDDTPAPALTQIFQRAENTVS